MKTDAIAATQFLADREAAGLPAATPAQLARATRLTEQNPLLRGHRSPLGLQMLAVQVPVTRAERRMERARLHQEIEATKADDTKSAEITKQLVDELSARINELTMKPVRIRGNDIKVEASGAAVESFIEANNMTDPLEAAEAIARMSGYASPTLALRRVARFTKTKTASSMPAHIRDKALVLSAIAQASDVIARRAAV